MATAKRLSSGNWRVLAYIGKENGKRKYASFTAPTKKQAEYEAALYSVRKKRANSSLTVGEAIDRYITSKDAVLSPRTVAGYRDLRKNALQALMPVKLDALKSEQVQLAVNEYSRTHAPKTVRNAVALLSSSLKMHAPDYHLSVTLPQPRRTEITIPEDNAVRLLLEAASPSMYTVLLLATALGLRRSEICGLEWQDLNEKQGTLRVCRAVVVNSSGEWVTKQTKTTSSTRTLAVPPFLMDHLRTLDRTAPRIVDIVNPAAITLRFLKLRKRLGLTLRFHDLRHYYASLLLALGVPDKYAMQRMGHSTTNMLKTVYQHLTDEKQKEIDQAIDRRMTALYGKPGA